MNTIVFQYSAAFLLALCMLGCGKNEPNLVIVDGMLTLDGNPLANKSVFFIAVNNTTGGGAGGSSDGTGKFHLKAVVPGALRDYDGIAPGEYRVTVVEPFEFVESSTSGEGESVLTPATPQAIDLPNAIPSIYSTDRSPLIVQIPETGGEIKLELSSNVER